MSEIPDRELLVHTNRELRGSLDRGLRQAAAGETINLGSFEQYADEEDGPDSGQAQRMRFGYDPETAAGYVQVRAQEGTLRQLHVHDAVILDVDEDGQLVGVEILGPPVTPDHHQSGPPAPERQGAPPVATAATPAPAPSSCSADDGASDPAGRRT